jgi:hypothetical protein
MDSAYSQCAPLGHNSLKRVAVDCQAIRTCMTFSDRLNKLHWGFEHF